MSKHQQSDPGQTKANRTAFVSDNFRNEYVIARQLPSGRFQC